MYSIVGPRRRISGGAICIAVFVLLFLSQLSSAASLETSQALSNEGYYQLSWETDEPVRLVESETAAFGDSAVIYSGADTGHVVSGKPDGVWYYRIESQTGSAVLAGPIEVTVRHHSLARASGFFAVGLLVFIATLALILFPRADLDERTQ